jgi:hypothetical protein
LGCLFLVTAGCGNAADETRRIELAPNTDMPGYVRDAPKQTQEAYRFAAANPEILAEIPCYCGCNAMEHRHNLACYVADMNAAGEVTKFDQHASYCDICVDITQDVMRLKRAGHSIEEIHDEIVTTYSKYGPPTLNEAAATN